MTKETVESGTTSDVVPDPNAPALLRVEDFTIFRGPLPAVRNISFTMSSGSLGILGRNGAGKSTLLGGIMGIFPSSGGIHLNGEDISHTPAWKRARQGMALVPQGRQLLPELTVDENLRLAQLEKVGDGPEWDIYELFPAIKQLLRRHAGILSGGEQQQIAIARALLRRPTALLLDEPAEGLAPIIISEITAVLAHLKTRGLKLVLADQHHHIVALLCAEFLVLRGGEAAGFGSADAGTIERYYRTL